MKAKFSNSFFSKQCFLSKLRTSPRYLTGKCLSTITFSVEDIRKLIRSHNPYKAHGHDNLSIRMLKLCGDAICEPLSVNFWLFFIWLEKEANIVPIHKKNDKQTLKKLSSSFLAPFRFFLHINKLQRTGPFSNLVIPASINVYQLLTGFVIYLMIV